jgi:hypothetical protein
MAMGRPLGIRWNIGDVSAAGYDSISLSIWGAWKIFGPEARYAVCVNTVPVSYAQSQVGPVPEVLDWVDATPLLPRWIHERYATEARAEGAGWRFAPPRQFPDRCELALDNDLILWDVPAAMALWLEQGGPHTCLLAEDAGRCYGRLDSSCAPGAWNAGLRGFPPHFDLESELRPLLDQTPEPLTITDEPGLHVAALTQRAAPLVVSSDDLPICNPFPPHSQMLGHCGVHFVGLNCKTMGWDVNGRPATEHIRANWETFLPAVQKKVGVRPVSDAPHRRPTVVIAR